MNGKIRIRCGFAVFALFAALLSSTLAGASMTPTETLKEAVGKAIAILENPAVNTAAGKERTVRELSSLSEQYFAFEHLTMLAVGRPWLEMSPDAQKKLTDAFRRLLELTYLKQVRQYGGEKVVYKREMIQASKAMVLTDVMAADKMISVNYKLIERDGHWYVYDIIGEGISLVKNYRSQFNEILHGGSTNDLIVRIEERVGALEAAQEKSE